MQLAADGPCLGCAPSQGLGFWDTLLTSALQAGATVYGVKSQKSLATEQLKAQIEQQKRDLENQRAIAQIQANAALAASQPMMQIQPYTGVTPPQPLTLPAPQMAPQPVYDVKFGGGLPEWVLPAGIVGGALVLALLLRRR